jgi:hypothetical protein
MATVGEVRVQNDLKHPAPPSGPAYRWPQPSCYGWAELG